MPRTQVSFATCNLYNLNEPGLRMYRDENGWSQEEYEKKLSWTTQAIANVPADVWAFQELWHAESLEKVFQQLASWMNTHCWYLQITQDNGSFALARCDLRFSSGSRNGLKPSPSILD